MSELIKKLTKKIDMSDLFIVLATPNYIDALRNHDGDILAHIKLASELKKPFFIVIDKRLSRDEKGYIQNYFSRNDIIKQIEIDLRYEKNIMAQEIKKLAQEIVGSDEDVEIITQNSHEDDTDKKSKKK